MESFCFFQEPLEPAPIKLEFLEFLEDATFVYPGVVSKLSPFYERKNDGVFEAVEDGPDPLQRKGIL